MEGERSDRAVVGHPVVVTLPRHATTSSTLQPPLWYRYFCIILGTATAISILFTIISVTITEHGRHAPSEFSVTSVLSALPMTDVSASHVRINMNITLSVRNREDDTSLYYDLVHAGLLYKDVFLANTTIDSFYQGKKDITAVEARFWAPAVNVDAWVRHAMAAESSDGAVEFNMVVEATVGLSLGTPTRKLKLVTAMCEGVMVDATTGSMQGEKNKCEPYPDPRAAFLRRLVVIIAASFIIAGTIVFIVWLVLRPRVPEFRVDSVSLSNFNLSSTSSLLTGNWDVKFAVSNPNHKISLYYDHIAASVFYKDESLSETTVAPFDQGTRNQTTVTATFSAAARYVDKKAADSILSDRTSRGSVDFNVRMVARVRLKAGSWQERRRFMRVYCGNLAVGLSSSSVGGTMVGGARECKVGL
ncbi:hypothetical protein Acr_28g0009580 [Actinidia rufa]|uniref:Late embryogenesis abundant protein LEA-2 subgroup domain-containing protein n=1 Tax=Actinidia rufa TaxID=165716 RepID=A0A7J0HAX9_9ERIC|nr:hypothetical protein Acr_28g0009580 [Actinidia rufa]